MDGSFKEFKEQVFQDNYVSSIEVLLPRVFFSSVSFRLRMEIRAVSGKRCHTTETFETSVAMQQPVLW